MRSRVLFAAVLLLISSTVFANCTEDELLSYIKDLKQFEDLDKVPAHAKSIWRDYCDYEKSAEEQQRLVNLMKIRIAGLESDNSSNKEEIEASKLIIKNATANVESQSKDIELLQSNLDLYTDTETVRQIGAILLGLTTLYLKSDLDSNATTLDMVVYGLGGYGSTLLLDDVTGRTVSTTIASWKF